MYLTYVCCIFSESHLSVFEILQYRNFQACPPGTPQWLVCASLIGAFSLLFFYFPWRKFSNITKSRDDSSYLQAFHVVSASQSLFSFFTQDKKELRSIHCIALNLPLINISSVNTEALQDNGWMYGLCVSGFELQSLIYLLLLLWILEKMIYLFNPQFSNIYQWCSYKNS